MDDDHFELLLNINRELGEVKTLVQEVHKRQDGALMRLFKSQIRHHRRLSSLENSRTRMYGIAAGVGGTAGVLGWLLQVLINHS